MKRVISTTAAPGAVGPYSQAVEANGFVFVSGQLPLDPATGAFVSDNTDEQAEQCIKNLLAVLAAAGCKAEDVVKATVFMIDIGEFSVVNEVYAKYFNGECPARCAMQVGALPHFRLDGRFDAESRWSRSRPLRSSRKQTETKRKGETQFLPSFFDANAV